MNSATLSIGGGATGLLTSPSPIASSNIVFIPAAAGLLLPPLITKCALAAQKKQRRNRATSTTRTTINIEEMLGSGVGPYNTVATNENLLSNLPIVQTRYERPHRQGALFCRSGTWLEIGGENHPAHQLRSHHHHRYTDDY